MTRKNWFGKNGLSKQLMVFLGECQSHRALVTAQMKTATVALSLMTMTCQTTSKTEPSRSTWTKWSRVGGGVWVRCSPKKTVKIWYLSWIYREIQHFWDSPKIWQGGRGDGWSLDEMVVLENSAHLGINPSESPHEAENYEALWKKVGGYVFWFFFLFSICWSMNFVNPSSIMPFWASWRGEWGFIHMIYLGFMTRGMGIHTYDIFGLHDEGNGDSYIWYIYHYVISLCAIC